MKAVVSTSIILALLAGAAPSNAQTSQQPAKPQTPAVDPKAIAALQNMGRFLRDQQSFTVDLKSQTDYIIDNGQKVQLSAHGDVRVRRPDHLRAEVISDRKNRRFFYDGKTFTIYSPRVGYYSTLDAPPTIIELADALQTRYGVELPLVDLFRWGSKEADFSQITSARYIGATMVDGVPVDQYAFRQPGVDWQIWIERGGNPLPRKLLLTTTDDPARPEFTLELSWELDAKHDDGVFVFTPPKDASRIAIAEAERLRAREPTERRATRSVRP